MAAALPVCMQWVEAFCLVSVASCVFSGPAPCFLSVKPIIVSTFSLVASPASSCPGHWRGGGGRKRPSFYYCYSIVLVAGSEAIESEIANLNPECIARK